MALVLVALALLATVPMAVMSTAVNQLPLTTRNLDWNGAFEAAQAGLSDYLQQLDANETYAQYNASDPDGNTAFTGWKAVAGTTNPPEWYEYTPTTTGGQLQLTVSGAAGYPGVGNVIRTFTYGLVPTSTLDDVYWSNYETDQAGADVNFDSNDNLDGPVFSNDDFYIDGNPTFASTVESANSRNNYADPCTSYSPGGPCWQDDSGGHNSDPDFEAGTASNPYPAYHPYENLTSNGVQVDVTPAQNFGCYINTTSGTGTVSMTLSAGSVAWSGGTLDTTDGNKGANCASPSSLSVTGTPSSGKNTVSGTGFTSSMVGMAVSGTDIPANTTVTAETSTQLTMSQDATGSPGSESLTLSATSGTITLSKLQSDLIMVNGNITVAGGGTVSGFLTLVSSATSGGITLDGSITYPSGDVTDFPSTTNPQSDPSDALGLIAYDDINVSDNDAATTLDAAVMAITGSFQNSYATTTCPTSGGNPVCPTLTVFGSIAQDYRGVVGYLNGSGQAFEGYGKAYWYDFALQTVWPPFFIPPSSAAWNPLSYAELLPGSAHEAVAGSTIP